jgi:hypothetical protein
MNLLEDLLRTNTYPSIRVRTQAHIEIKQGKAPRNIFFVGVLEFAVSCFTLMLLIFSDFAVLIPYFQSHCICMSINGEVRICFHVLLLPAVT